MRNGLVLLLALVGFGLVGCGGKDSYEKIGDDTVAFNNELMDLIEGLVDGDVDEAKASDVLDGLREKHLDLRKRLKELPAPTIEETKEMMTKVSKQAKEMSALTLKAISSGKISKEISDRIGSLGK